MAQGRTILQYTTEKTSFLRDMKASSLILSLCFNPVSAASTHPSTEPQDSWAFLEISASLTLPILLSLSSFALFIFFCRTCYNGPPTSPDNEVDGWAPYPHRQYNVHFYTNDSQIYLFSHNLSPFIQPCLSLSLWRLFLNVSMQILI